MQVDTNKDGYICVWELEDFINSSNEEAKVVPRHVVKKIHKMADDNGDQKLDYREFVNMLEHPDLQHLFGRYVTRWVFPSVIADTDYWVDLGNK